MPKKFIQSWLNFCEKYLKAKGYKFKQEISIVFLNQKEAKALNLQYRNKAYATDILSFEMENVLGELVICPQVLKAQANEHQFKFREELGYMLIHGVLHLLGFDHESNRGEAEKMFKLQDQLFDLALQKLK